MILQTHRAQCFGTALTAFAIQIGQGDLRVFDVLTQEIVTVDNEGTIQPIIDAGRFLPISRQLQLTKDCKLEQRKALEQFDPNSSITYASLKAKKI